MQKKQEIAQAVHNSFQGEEHYIGTEIREDSIIVYVESRILCDYITPILKEYGVRSICAKKIRSK